MKILFLSRWLPYPVDNGSKLRIYNLLRVLARHNEITLISFNDNPNRQPDVAELLEVCVKVMVVPWHEFRPSSFKAILGFLSCTPRAVLDTYSTEMAQLIRETVNNNDFDVIIASQIETASYFNYFGKIPAVFEEVEIGVPYNRFMQATGFWQWLRSGLTWFKHRFYLRWLLKHFCVSTVVSEKELALLRETGIRSENVVVIPNFIDLADYTYLHTVEKKNYLIFTGSFRYRPNYEGIRWFVEKVFPLVVEKIPDIKLVITGDHLNLPLPFNQNVELTGHVDDSVELRMMLACAKLSIVPLLVGGGSRLKILEALAIKTPVVSTTKGAEGLNVIDGENILIADTPISFARCVVRALQDNILFDKLSDNGFTLAREQYSSDSIELLYSNLLNKYANIS